MTLLQALRTSSLRRVPLAIPARTKVGTCPGGRMPLQRAGVHARHLHRNAPNPIPASFLRGGTSKGIFLNRADLPQDQEHWDPIFLGIMGSPDPEYGRQLNGMGGGVSSLSKICVVEKPSETQEKEGIDVVYTFVQVGIRDASIDYSGNCGNLSSMIGVYALDAGLCRLPKVDSLGRVTICSLNTNTNKIIDTNFPVATVEENIAALLDLPQVSIAGVPGMASKIVLDFVSPAGARTGKLLPTGGPFDRVTQPHSDHKDGKSLQVSLVDATNPTIFVDARELSQVLLADEDPTKLDYNDRVVQAFVEDIRQSGAKLMGLDPKAQAQPKIAMVYPPPDDASEADIVIRAFSMGVPHKAVPMTVGLCLGVASQTEGTIPWKIVQKQRSTRRKSAPSDTIIMQHPGGYVEVGAEWDAKGNVEVAKVVRTGRRLMKGVVWW